MTLLGLTLPPWAWVFIAIVILIILILYRRVDSHLLTRAQSHLNLKQDCLNQARFQPNLNKREQLYKKSQMHGKSAVALMKRHFEENPHSTTLDLHYFSTKEAINVLNSFLDMKINNCWPFSGPKIVRVVTGKGNRSEGGVPKIKPAVEETLRKRGIKFSEEKNNGGCLKVEIRPNIFRLFQIIVVIVIILIFFKF